MTAPPGRQWIGFALVYASLALLFGWYARIQLSRYRVAVEQAAGIYVCLLSLFALYLAPGFAAPRAWLAPHFRGTSGAVRGIAIFLLPYLIYSALTGDFRAWALFRLFALAALPLALFAAVPVREIGRLNWQDVVVLLWLMSPVMLGSLGGIWNVPVNLDFIVRIFVVGIGAWAFLIMRGVEKSGYEFCFSPAILRDALLSFAGFAAIGLPLGWALHFIAWNPQWHGLGTFLFDYVTIFLFVAIAEELLFRGLLQNLLEGSFQSRGVAQAAASILFGLTHIRHAPFPNWRYVALASVAGWFYGMAYRRHRSLMASATTHALVDTVWRTWFTLVRV